MTKTRRRFTAVLLAGALLAGACSEGGGSEEVAENPKQALVDAFEALSEYEGIEMVMSLEADADDLANEDLPIEQAEQLVESSITIRGKQATTPEDQQVEFVVNVGGNEDAVELKAVGESIYVRADVRELVETFGGSTAEIDTAVQQASAAGLDFVEPLVEGEWVGVEGLNDLAEQFGVTVPTPDPEQADALAKRLTAVFEENADVSSEGSDDVGDHLLVRVPLKEFVTETFDVLLGASGLPAGALPMEDLEQIPEDAVMPIDVWIADGAVAQVELDFVRFAEEFGEDVPEGIEQVAMRFTFEEFTDEVEAPSDFVEIDLQEILQGFLGAMPGTEGLDTGSAIEAPSGEREVVLPELGLACEDLQTLSPDEIETFLGASGMPGAVKKIRQACPELF